MPFPTPRSTFSLAALAAVLALATSVAQAADYVTGATDLGTLSAPITLTYSDAFNDTDPSTPGIQLFALGTLLPTDTFYDDYAFSITDASFSAISATIDLGSVFQISNLQARLYRGTLPNVTAGPVGADLVQAWSALALTAQGSGTGSVQVISPIDLQPGDYILEVRGNITGTSGGSYAGVMNLAAVPEPGAIGMMIAGLAVLGTMARRRT